MSAAKTTAERTRDLRARRHAAGLQELRGVWVHPDDAPAVRAFAARLLKMRQSKEDRHR